jgi:hypothetical protein
LVELQMTMPQPYQPVGVAARQIRLVQYADNG